MRKFIALGAGVLTAATLAFGPVSPAHAVVAPPASLTGQVCAGLPAQITDAATTLTNATVAKTAAAANLVTKAGELATAQSAIIAALVDYIQTYDNGGALDVKTLVLQNAASTFTQKATAWGNASTAVEVANRNFDIASMAPPVLAGLSSGLSCVA
jgi:hypothetical protein